MFRVEAFAEECSVQLNRVALKETFAGRIADERFFSRLKEDDCLDPRDTHHTLDSLENKIEDLEADYEYLEEKRRAGARGVRKDLEDSQEMYDVLRNSSS